MAASVMPGRPKEGHPPKGERDMRNRVRHSRSERTQPAFEEGHGRGDLALVPDDADSADDAALDTLRAEEADGADDAEDGFDDEFGDALRLTCPDCGRPIVVAAERQSLPEHALCPTPWNPFGLTVCTGSGRAVAEALPLDGAGVAAADQAPELTVLRTALPAGLDWRTQPFSHVGGPGSRPIRTPAQGLAA
jgi:hypothetical protein